MIDWNKPIETINGTPAELIVTCTNGRSNSHPRVVRYIDSSSEKPEVLSVTEEGHLYSLQFIRNRAQPRRFRNLYRKDGELRLGRKTFATLFEAAKEAAACDSTCLGAFEETA